MSKCWKYIIYNYRLNVKAGLNIINIYYGLEIYCYKSFKIHYT